MLSICLSTNYEEAVDSPSAHGQLLAVLNSCIVLSDAGVMAWYVKLPTRAAFLFQDRALGIHTDDYLRTGSVESCRGADGRFPIVKHIS